MRVNPVLPGCHPDPSVVRVGADYYLVTSTFEYFPGLPLFHSTDLERWAPIGHAIDRADQLDLSTVPASGGLFAPTIRHHDGTFFIVNTLVAGSGRQGTFVITATDPAGDWSDPVWLDDAPGIDPSLFFDDDGRAWICGTELASPGLWEGQTEVWLSEFDPVALRLIGPRHPIWHGALHGAVWAEGPHLYRVDDRYYLLAAEGGTERNHAVCIAVAETVTGPYRGDPANPVLTHRHLGRSAGIVGVGHAELVETPAGGWAAFLLATRAVPTSDARVAPGDAAPAPEVAAPAPRGAAVVQGSPAERTGSTLGRETVRVAVAWEDGWPVFAPGVGLVVAEPSPDVAVHDDFDDATLAPEWTLVRTSTESRYDLGARPGFLRLPARAATLTAVGAPAFVGRRQQHLRATLTARVEFAPGGAGAGAGADAGAGATAGLAVRQSESAQLRLELDARGSVRAVIRADDRDTLLGSVRADRLDASFAATLSIRLDGFDATFVVDGVDLARCSTLALSSEHAGGFLGVWMGAFASGNGSDSPATLDVDWMRYDGSDL
ncbi:glycoside hydrolase family 43 protein [Galbitalea soli]|uniref:Glycoside hydrolase family 43 protein n=1 Tax=Galbitalea soli TaxID=1268042 RepID=A0A7C9PPX4_9MICO|nr:glycoside hydrolase family 43 protein [Galbitalea soli]